MFGNTGFKFKCHFTITSRRKAWMLTCSTLGVARGGHSLKNRVRVCAALQTPLSCLPGPSKCPNFNTFSILKPLLSSSNQKFQEIWSSQASKFLVKISKSSVPKPQIDSNWAKIQLTWLHFVYGSRVSQFGSGPLRNLSVQPFGSYTCLSKWKLSAPPPTVL